jgi:hypothetical protein
MMLDPAELPARDMFGARPGEYPLPANAFPAKCASCGMAIVFCRTAAGKQIPLSLATVEEREGIKYAVTHFADCPQAKEWSGKGKKA